MDSTALDKRHGNAKYDFDMGQVGQWYAEGASVREIARRMGTSSRTMWRHMNNAGIQMRPPGAIVPPPSRPVSTQEREAILQALAEAAEIGVRQVDMAKKFGRAEATIRRVERHQHLSEQPSKKMAAARIAEEKVRALHSEGLHGYQIDARLGWRPGRAGAFQRRLGLDPRPGPAPTKLKELYESLGTVKALAGHLGCSDATASRKLKDAGIPVVRTGGPRPPHRLEPHLVAIREAYTGSERATIAQLAARYGESRGVIQGFLQQHGIKAFNRVTADERAEMLRLRAEGLSVAEIGRRLERPEFTVWSHLQRESRPEG